MSDPPPRGLRRPADQQFSPRPRRSGAAPARAAAPSDKAPVSAAAAAPRPARRRLQDRIRGELRLTGLAIWRGVGGVYDSDDLTFASSIAYYALLSLFPFFLLVFSAIATITSSEQDRGAVLEFVLQYFPRRFEFVTMQLTSMQGAQLRLGIAGSLLMMWAALGFFGAVTSAVNHAWGVERQPSYLKHKLISFVMLLMASVLLLAGLALVSATSVVEANWFAGVVERTPGLMVLRGLAAEWATTVIFILVVGLIFYFVPNAQVRFRDVWVGAVLTGLLWRVALAGFSWYVRDLGRFNVHGSIAAVVVFLFWIYISAVIFLYGVEVTAANARLRRHRPDEIPAAPAPRV